MGPAQQRSNHHLLYLNMNYQHINQYMKQGSRRNALIKGPLYYTYKYTHSYPSGKIWFSIQLDKFPIQCIGKTLIKKITLHYFQKIKCVLFLTSWWLRNSFKYDVLKSKRFRVSNSKRKLSWNAIGDALPAQHNKKRRQLTHRSLLPHC